jgi:acylphosphatase
MPKRVYAVVSGRVQNVGFRISVLRRANALKLAGWVRNSDDIHRLELEVQGEDNAVDDLVTWLHRGPAGARVSSVDVVAMAIDPNASPDFMVL